MISLWLVLLGLAVVLVSLLVVRMHAFLALILAAMVVALATPLSHGLPTADAPTKVMKAFGDTCGKMGLLIAMAAIIGKCLLDSGAAMRIVQAILSLFGQARAHIAFVFTGFFLAIPVFFDAVFYLLMPIGKAMAARLGKNYLLYILTVVAGATMAHSLVPPTPGPLLAAKELGVPIGKMMAGGCIVGLFTASFGLLYAVWANRRWTIPLPEDAHAAADHDASVQKLPPLWFSLLPIVVPVALITWGAITGKEREQWFHDGGVALGFGAGIALLLLSKFRREDDATVKDAVQDSIMSGATVLMITAAGGAFGASLRETGIAELIQRAGAGVSPMWALPICFAITSLVRIAQGSATVAMITVAPIAAAFLASGQLGFDAVYLALAVGCGSKPIPWMNDSGFWIITRMTGMRETDTLKIVTPMMSLMGVVGLPVVMVGAWLFPRW
jgi:GntP family gluconate:H+ symporter